MSLHVYTPPFPDTDWEGRPLPTHVDGNAVVRIEILREPPFEGMPARVSMKVVVVGAIGILKDRFSALWNAETQEWWWVDRERW